MSWTNSATTNTGVLLGKAGDILVSILRRCTGSVERRARRRRRHQLWVEMPAATERGGAALKRASAARGTQATAVGRCVQGAPVAGDRGGGRRPADRGGRTLALSPWEESRWELVERITFRFLFFLFFSARPSRVAFPVISSNSRGIGEYRFDSELRSSGSWQNLPSTRFSQ
jgi:hypothetical protein